MVQFTILRYTYDYETLMDLNNSIVFETTFIRLHDKCNFVSIGLHKIRTASIMIRVMVFEQERFYGYL